MAVKTVNEHLESRSGGDQDNELTRRRRRFIVEVNDIDNTEEDVLAHESIPQMLDPYVTPAGVSHPLFVIRREARQDENPYIWFVEVEYSSSFLTERTRIDFHYEGYREALLHDADGDDIINTADELFLPAPEVERYQLVVTLTRFEDAFNPLVPWKYLGSLNQGIFVILGRDFAARSCLLADVRAGDRREQFPTYEVTYVIKIRRVWVTPSTETGRVGGAFSVTFPETGSGWDLRLINQGFRYRPTAGADPQEYRPGGSPPSNPIRLNTDGTKLPAGSDPIWLTFQIYPTLDWATMDLNTDSSGA